MSTNKNRVNIKHLPDRLQLASCMMIGNDNQQIPVLFDMVDEGAEPREWREHVLITNIGREDWNGSVFSLKGRSVTSGCDVEITISYAAGNGMMSFIREEVGSHKLVAVA